MTKSSILQQVTAVETGHGKGRACWCHQLSQEVSDGTPWALACAGFSAPWKVSQSVHLGPAGHPLMGQAHSKAGGTSQSSRQHVPPAHGITCAGQSMEAGTCGDDLCWGAYPQEGVCLVKEEPVPSWWGRLAVPDSWADWC